ncbi:MAG: hypothetical protein ACM30E_08915 [Nitrososphaerales archaeon]
MVTSSPQNYFTRVGSINTRYRVQGMTGSPLLTCKCTSSTNAGMMDRADDFNKLVLEFLA